MFARNHIASATGIGLFVVVVFSMLGGTSVESIPSDTSLEHASSTLPSRLIIPKIGVDAAVEYVGLTPSGAMGTPKGPAEVAWFNQGPRPGEIGSAVITGHFGWKDNIPAVFDEIHTLRTGDTLYVEDGKGTVITFVVREIRTYDEKADASDVFGSSDGKAHLNLITCEGVWDAVSKNYSKRLVIFTDQET